MFKGYKANQRQIKETKVNIQRISRILCLSFVKFKVLQKLVSAIPKCHTFLGLTVLQ